MVLSYGLVWCAVMYHAILLHKVNHVVWYTVVYHMACGGDHQYGMMYT